MVCRSLLIVQLKPGTRVKAVEAYHARGILEECAEAIPEFVEGRVCLSETDADRIIIEVDWSDPKGWQDWMSHPVRAAQSEDIGVYIESVVLSEVYAL